MDLAGTEPHFALLDQDRSVAGRPATFACIAGAPRCGTTSLAGFLGEHPDIRFSIVKEPHFFSLQDLSGSDPDRLKAIVRDQYLARFFPGAPSDGKLLAEGSVSYLYAPERMRAILRLWPDARFVIALRDPIAMLPSLHRRLLYIGDEAEPDFARAWALAPARARGREIPRSCIDPRFLQYPEIGRLGAHVERFFAAVGRERCFVALFDDLVADPQDLYSRLLAFLGLPDQPRTEFEPRRESRLYRIGWLQRLLKRPPVATRAVLAGEKFRHRVRSLGRDPATPAWLKPLFAARKRLLDWNTIPAGPVTLSAELVRELRETFADDVALLERLIGRDLGHWLGRTRPALLDCDQF